VNVAPKLTWRPPYAASNLGQTPRAKNEQRRYDKEDKVKGF
jgi:hypothetical protein